MLAKNLAIQNILSLWTCPCGKNTKPEHLVGAHKKEAALSISSVGKYEQVYIVEMENRFLESMGQISSMQEGKWAGCKSAQHS